MERITMDRDSEKSRLEAELAASRESTRAARESMDAAVAALAAATRPPTPATPPPAPRAPTPPAAPVTPPTPPIPPPAPRTPTPAPRPPTPPAPPVTPPAPGAAPRTPELAILEASLDEARKKYAEGYRKFMDNAKAITRVKEFVFGANIKDSEIPPRLKNLEREYDIAAVAYGEKMHKEKFDELAASGLGDAEIRTELKRYRQNEIFTEVVIKEQAKLSALRAENLPPKEKGMVGKSLEWYMKQPRWKKLAISTALSTAVIATFSGATVAAAGGLATFAGARATRAVAGSVVGQSAAKAYDWLFKEKSAAKRAAEEKKLAEEFKEETFDVSLAKNKKEYALILEREQKAKRIRLVTKAMVTIAAGGLTSYGMGHMLHGSPDHIDTSAPKTPEAAGTAEAPDVSGGRGAAPIPDTASPASPTSPVSPPQPPASAGGSTPPIEHAPLTPGTATTNLFAQKSATFEAGSGKGGIQGVIDLRAQLKDAYHGDYSSAPKSVQDFMAEPNATKLAEKLGLYNPDDVSGKESALIQGGSVLKFDEHGNLLFGKPDASGNIPVLEKGKITMFDSDRSAMRGAVAPEKNTNTENTFAKTYYTPAEARDRVLSNFETPDQASDSMFSKVKFGEISAEDSTVETRVSAEALNGQIKARIPESQVQKSGENVIYNSRVGSRPMQTNVVETGRGQGGQNVRVNNTLNELPNNPYNLSPEVFKQVENTYGGNLTHLYGDYLNDPKTVNWIKEDLLKQPAKNIIEDMKDVNIGEDKFHGPLVKYFHKIQEVLGEDFKPKGKGWNPFGQRETVEEFLKRGLIKAAQVGKLDQIKL